VGAALLSSAALAQPWKKPAEKWNLEDTYRILQDSPWVPLKSGLKAELTWMLRHTDPQTGLPSALPDRPVEKVRAVKLGTKERPLPAVSVMWWSAKSVRLARQRQMQLRGEIPDGEPLHAAPLDAHVVIVEGLEALRILQDAERDLDDSVYLELPGGMALDLVRVEFHEGERAGEDFVAFYFPREKEGRTVIEPNTARVVFYCKATARSEMAGRPNVLTVRATFEPRKMRFGGQPDL
jgi:hypothetical protein